MQAILNHSHRITYNTNMAHKTSSKELRFYVYERHHIAIMQENISGPIETSNVKKVAV